MNDALRIMNQSDTDLTLQAAAGHRDSFARIVVLESVFPVFLSAAICVSARQSNRANAGMGAQKRRTPRKRYRIAKFQSKIKQ